MYLSQLGYLVILVVCFSQTSLHGYEISFEDEDWEGHTFLVSYGGSGNTWLRYCLEFLTKRPTFRPDLPAIIRSDSKKIELDMVTKHMRKPINNTIPLGVDYSKKPILKSHEIEEVIKKIPKASSATLILLMRNPKECLYRLPKATAENILASLSDPQFSFYKNLQAFNRWNPNKRFIIYYEDIIQKPEQTLFELLTFLGEDDRYLSVFMRDFAYHKQCSIDFYHFTNHISQSKGKDPLYHSKKLSREQRIAIDNVLKKTRPYLWKNYLLRYQEPENEY